MNKKKGRDTNIARGKLFQTPLLHIGIALSTKQLFVLHNDFRAASNVGEMHPHNINPSHTFSSCCLFSTISGGR